MLNRRFILDDGEVEMSGLGIVFDPQKDGYRKVVSFYGSIHYVSRILGNYVGIEFNPPAFVMVESKDGSGMVEKELMGITRLSGATITFSRRYTGRIRFYEDNVPSPTAKRISYRWGRSAAVNAAYENDIRNSRRYRDCVEPDLKEVSVIRLDGSHFQLPEAALSSLLITKGDYKGRYRRIAPNWYLEEDA